MEWNWRSMNRNYSLERASSRLMSYVLALFIFYLQVEHLCFQARGSIELKVSDRIDHESSTLPMSYSASLISLA